MLMALSFEPGRFFLKGKVRQKKTSYIHKHTVRVEVSQVLVPGTSVCSSVFLSHFAFEKEPARFET